MRVTEDVEEDDVEELRLSIACSSYDRTRPMMDGRVRIDGIKPIFLDLPLEEIFFRMMRHHEFDVAEMSLSSYTISLFSEKPPLIAIPIFLSRFFRHSGIFINRNSGIREPKDLIGKRVGVPEYQLTACVWIRGILSDEYSVPVSSVTYFRGGEEQPGRLEKIAVSLPPEIRIENIPATKTLSQMLAEGEIDAIYSPRIPSTLHSRPEAVTRLFPDYEKVEKEYWARTKMFPIMHTVAIRRELYEENGWIAQNLCKAFVRSQREAYHELADAGALKCMLPWLLQHAEDTRSLMGADFWPYGFEPNIGALGTFLRYSHEQGLSKRLLDPRELFAPESLESFKV